MGSAAWKTDFNLKENHRTGWFCSSKNGCRLFLSSPSCLLLLYCMCSIVKQLARQTGLIHRLIYEEAITKCGPAAAAWLLSSPLLSSISSAVRCEGFSFRSVSLRPLTINPSTVQAKCKLGLSDVILLGWISSHHSEEEHPCVTCVRTGLVPSPGGEAFNIASSSIGFVGLLIFIYIYGKNMQANEAGKLEEREAKVVPGGALWF